MSKVRLTRIFWIGAAAMLVASALVAIGALIRGHFGVIHLRSGEQPVLRKRPS
jgi:hypothetical protein